MPQIDGQRQLHGRQRGDRQSGEQPDRAGSRHPGTSLTVGAGTTNAALGFTAATTSALIRWPHSDTITLRVQGGGLTSPVDITLKPTVAGTTTSAGLLADLQTKICGQQRSRGGGNQPDQLDR